LQARHSDDGKAGKGLTFLLLGDYNQSAPRIAGSRLCRAGFLIERVAGRLLSNRDGFRSFVKERRHVRFDEHVGKDGSVP
jgi:hypothetical protein